MRSILRIAVLAGALGAAAANPGGCQGIEVSKIDTNHSTVGFSVPILDGWSEVEGKFTDFAIVIHYEAADVTRSTVQATIQARSINTGIADRDDDLRSKNFFDVAQFPEIRFTSSRIEPRGDQLLVHGDLTMHGVTKPVALPVTLRVKKAKGDALLFSVVGDLELNRDDWGIAWRHPVDGFVSGKVLVRLRVLSKLIPPAPPATAKP